MSRIIITQENVARKSDRVKLLRGSPNECCHEWLCLATLSLPPPETLPSRGQQQRGGKNALFINSFRPFLRHCQLNNRHVGAAIRHAISKRNGLNGSASLAPGGRSTSNSPRNEGGTLGQREERTNNNKYSIQPLKHSWLQPFPP